MKIELFSNEDFAKAFPLAAGAWGEFYADERSLAGIESCGR